MRIYIDVIDNRGKRIKGLTSNNFKVIEDGKEIKEFEISFVYAGGEWLDIILGIDRSGSMKGEPLEKAKKCAWEFINCLSFFDNAALLIFDDRIEFLTDFKKDKKLLSKKINSIRAGKDTALYDAVLISLERIEKATSTIKAIIFFTDGKDTLSKIRIERLVERIKKSNIPIFMIGIDGDVNKTVLKKISSSSGKRFFYNPISKDIVGLYDSIAKNLGIHYLISYHSKASRSKAVHTVEIQFKTIGTFARDKRYFSIY